MKAREIFSEAIIIYLRKIWVYLLLSTAITSSLLIRFTALSQNGFSYLNLFLTWLFVLISVVFSVCAVLYTLKTRPGKKTVPLSLVWSFVFLLAEVLFRLSFISEINVWCVCVVAFVIFWMLASFFVLSVCHMIRGTDSSLIADICSNSKLYIKSNLYTLMFFFIFLFVALGSAQPGKIATMQPLPELISKRESILFCVFLFLFVPLYIVIFTELYKAITDRRKG